MPHLAGPLHRSFPLARRGARHSIGRFFNGRPYTRFLAQKHPRVLQTFELFNNKKKHSLSIQRQHRHQHQHFARSILSLVCFFFLFFSLICCIWFLFPYSLLARLELGTKSLGTRFFIVLCALDPCLTPDPFSVTTRPGLGAFPE